MKTFNDLKKGDYIYQLSSGVVTKRQLYSFIKYKWIFKFSFGKGCGYWRYDMHYINDYKIGNWVSDPAYIIEAIQEEE